MATGQKNTYGPRRRFKGKRGIPIGHGSHRSVAMRGHTSGGHSPSRDGFECNQTEPYPSKILPGKFRVQMPRNRVRYVDPRGREVASR